MVWVSWDILVHQIRISDILSWSEILISPMLSYPGSHVSAVYWLYWNSHVWSSSDITVMLKQCHHVTLHIQELLGAFFKHKMRYFMVMEHSGWVVECLTRDRGAAGSSLSCVTVLCPWARHIYPCLVLVQPRKTRPTIYNWKIVEWDVRNQTNKQISWWARKRIHYYIVWGWDRKICPSGS